MSTATEVHVPVYGLRVNFVTLPWGSSLFEAEERTYRQPGSEVLSAADVCRVLRRVERNPYPQHLKQMGPTREHLRLSEADVTDIYRDIRRRVELERNYLIAKELLFFSRVHPKIILHPDRDKPLSFLLRNYRIVREHGELYLDVNPSRSGSYLDIGQPESGTIISVDWPQNWHPSRSAIEALGLRDHPIVNRDSSDIGVIEDPKIHEGLWTIQLRSDPFLSDLYVRSSKTPDERSPDAAPLIGTKLSL